MNNEDVLQRNAAGELEIRTAPSTGDTGTNPDDVYTRDEQGRLCVRTTGGGGGGGGGASTAASVSFDPAGLKTITAENVQSALQQVDAALPQPIQYTHIGTTENMDASWVIPFVKAGVLADGEYYFYIKSYRASSNNANGQPTYGYITNKITFVVNNNAVVALNIQAIMDGETVPTLSGDIFSLSWIVPCFTEDGTNNIDIYCNDIVGSDYLIYSQAPTTPLNVVFGTDLYAANGTIIPVEYEFVQTTPSVIGVQYNMGGNPYVPPPAETGSISYTALNIGSNIQYTGFVCYSQEIPGPNTSISIGNVYPTDVNVAFIVDAENMFIGKASVSYGGVYKSEIMVATGVFENMVFVVYQNTNNQYYLGIAKADNSSFTVETDKIIYMYLSWDGTGSFTLYFDSKTNDNYTDYTVLQNIPVIPTLPNAPTADGTYIPELTITGGVQSVSWVLKTA